MLRALLLAAACSLAGCSQIVNLSPVQSNPDMLSPQRADRVEVFNRTTPPDRPYSKYVLLETKATGIPSRDAAALRAKGGAAGPGLGLSLVRDITRMHGGDVKMQSRLGEGTSVTIILPRSGPAD